MRCQTVGASLVRGDGGSAGAGWVVRGYRGDDCAFHETSDGGLLNARYAESVAVWGWAGLGDGMGVTRTRFVFGCWVCKAVICY